MFFFVAEKKKKIASLGVWAFGHGTAEFQTHSSQLTTQQVARLFSLGARPTNRPLYVR